jgi:hypothetical protein
MNLQSKKSILIEHHWMILHTRGWKGFYYGSYTSRKDAQNTHVRKIGGTWKQAYRRGDRAIRVAITDDLIGLLEEAQRGLYP